MNRHLILRERRGSAIWYYTFEQRSKRRTFLGILQMPRFDPAILHARINSGRLVRYQSIEEFESVLKILTGIKAPIGESK